jgi:hypothetical protein
MKLTGRTNHDQENSGFHKKGDFLANYQLPMKDTASHTTVLTDELNPYTTTLTKPNK